MLGWMLKRGLEGRDAQGDSDDTQTEQPDTPGPVFAARAFKSAIFGTPARLENNSTIWSEASKNSEIKEPTFAEAISASSTPAEEELPEETNAKTSKDTKDNRDDDDDNNAAQSTPGRLPGILLTPGTGTARRKRVSFGNDVEEKDGDRKKEFRINRDTRNRQNLFEDPKPATSRDRARHRPRSKLVEALENSRRQNTEAIRAAASEKVDMEKELRKERRSQPHKGEQKTHKYPPKPAVLDGPEEDDAQWEEVDDAEWDPDVTVDLNVPHSQSGQYWKAQFQRYQEDAKVEMSKLLKYKQLAKSYAKMKDAESVDLHAKLREEKDKVTKMEVRITDLANQIARKRMKGTDRDYQGLISDLTRQTALAVQYRNQVKELEAMLNDDWDGDLSQQQEALDEEITTGHVSRRWHQHPATTKVTSPRTHKTLMDTQRELRRARDQVKEMALVKDEVKRLKTALRESEQRVRKGESGSKTMAADLAASEAAADAAKAKAEDLEKRAKFAEDERRRKDEELRLLQHKYDALKDDAKARVGEAEQVLRRKNEQIAELKKEVRQATKQAQVAKEQLAAAQTSQSSQVVPAIANTDRFPSAESGDKGKPVFPQQEPASRRRYESLRGKRTEHLAERLQPRHSQHEPMDGFALKLDDLCLDPACETELRKQHPPAVNIHEDINSNHILDDTRNFQLPLLRKSKSTVRLRTKSKLAEDGENEANRVDDMISLRRRRGTDALRSIESRQNLDDAGKLAASAATKVSTLRTKRPLSMPMAGSEEPKIDLFGSRFARLGETTTEIQQPPEQQLMDSSRLSLSSERAAAAVARIEKRRAERRKALDSARNKENVQPLM